MSKPEVTVVRKTPKKDMRNETRLKREPHPPGSSHADLPSLIKCRIEEVVPDSQVGILRCGYIT